MADCYRIFGRPVASDIPLPEAGTLSRATPACTIELSSRCDAPHIAIREWRLRTRGRWLAFARCSDEYALSFPGLAEFHVSRAGDRIRCRSVRGIPAVTLRHLLLDQVLPLAFSRSGCLALHASSVLVPGIGALAIAGRSGAGKSSLAAALASRGCPLITDDCLVLACPRDIPLALPGYPGLRLWQDAARALWGAGATRRAVAHYTTKGRVAVNDFCATPFPLHAIFVLIGRYRGGPPIRVRSAPSGQSLIDLVRYTYLLDVHDREQLSRSFLDLAALTERVPVARLRVRHDADRLPEIADALRTEAERGLSLGKG